MDPRAPQHDDTPAPGDLETTAVPPEDIEGALRFLHLVDTQTKARVAELSATVSALVELLVGGGQVPLDAYEKRKRLTMVRENERAAGEAGVAVADIPDKYALKDLPQIDCASLLHLCKARCCKLRFPLSVQDLDERAVRWNYSAPYQIAQRPDGYCVHNKPDGGCDVYTHRPGVCRTYDCRRDRRIWIDFDRRVPAA